MDINFDYSRLCAQSSRQTVIVLRDFLSYLDRFSQESFTVRIFGSQNFTRHIPMQLENLYSQSTTKHGINYTLFKITGSPIAFSTNCFGFSKLIFLLLMIVKLCVTEVPYMNLKIMPRPSMV